MTRFYDTVPVQGLRTTADGYLVGEAPVARSGVQVYAGHEVGRPDLAVVRVYRPPEEVFSADALRSYAHRPITVGHPPERVTADNWRDLTVGQTGDEVLRDGDLVRVPLALMDAAAIKKHDMGIRQLSMGYDAELEFVDGTTPDGETYDAVQSKQRMNHLALVPSARGGNRLRLGDNDGGTTMNEGTSKLRTVTVDGLAVETTDAGAQAIERLQKDADKLREQVATLQSDHAEALKNKDAEIAKKDAEIDDLNGKVIDDASLDERVRARAELMSTAKAVADIDYAGKTDAEIRRAAVVAKLGDAAIDGKTDAYVDARFDILAEECKVTGPANDAMRQRVHTRPTTNDNGQAGYEQRLTGAWKTDQKTA